MKINMTAIAFTAMTLGTGAIAEVNFDHPNAIMEELMGLSEECATLKNGEVKTEVFGIEMIRLENTCAIVNGSEIDERVLVFLEEQNLSWVGVGIWVHAPATSN